MRRKDPVPFTHKFPNIDPVALKLLQRLIAFDPKDRPSAQEVSLKDIVKDPVLFTIMLVDAFCFLLCAGIG